MDIRSNRLYPYPVKGKMYDDYISDDYETSIDIEKDGYSYILKFVAKLNDPVLKELIKQKKVCYAYHMECAKTAFRQIIRTDKQKEFLKIDETEVSGTLQICPFLIAIEDINNYVNPDFNKDYKGMSFNINSGCPLAVGEQINFDFEKVKTDASNRGSIFSIIRLHDETKDSFQIEFEETDKIVILIPSKIFEKFDLLYQNTKLQPLLNSFVIVPALVFVLDAIKTEFKKDELGPYTERMWFKTINSSINKLYGVDITINSLATTKKETYEIAQELIRNPLIPAIDYLWNDKGEG